MIVQRVTVVRVVAILIALGSLMPVPVAAQQSSSAGTSVPRTLDGRPDLQGVWDFRTITPLERPTELGDKAVLTAEEATEELGIQKTSCDVAG